MEWFHIYLLLINAVTFLAFALDKYKAVHGLHRIRVVTLLGLSVIGGAAGGYLAMYLFRHKTRKTGFVIGMPVMLLMQLIALLFVMNVR